MRPKRKIPETGEKPATSDRPPERWNAGVRKRDVGFVDRTSSKRDATDAAPNVEKPADNDAVLDWSVLMAHAQDGDGEAYARLLKDMTPYLRSLAVARLSSPSDVEDAVQEVLLTIHRLRHTYDPNRPFGPWLVTIAKRRIIDRFRKTMRRSTKETALLPSHETFLVAPANRIEERADRHALKKAINDLSPSQRQAIRLLKLEEMSLKEASAATGMSISALKVATHRALKSLKRKIGDWNE